MNIDYYIVDFLEIIYVYGFLVDKYYLMTDFNTIFRINKSNNWFDSVLEDNIVIDSLCDLFKGLKITNQKYCYCWYIVDDIKMKKYT